MRKKFFIVILLKFQIAQILLVTSYYYVKKLYGLEMDAETYVRFESFQKGQSP